MNEPGEGPAGKADHFVPNREIDVSELNRALVDVFGEKGLRGRRLELEIDEDYWRDVAEDDWSGNIYRYNF